MAAWCNKCGAGVVGGGAVGDLGRPVISLRPPLKVHTRPRSLISNSNTPEPPQSAKGDEGRLGG